VSLSGKTIAPNMPNPLPANISATMVPSVRLACMSVPLRAPLHTSCSKGLGATRRWKAWAARLTPNLPRVGRARERIWRVKTTLSRTRGDPPAIATASSVNVFVPRTVRQPNRKALGTYRRKLLLCGDLPAYEAYISISKGSPLPVNRRRFALRTLRKLHPRSLSSSINRERASPVI
jgi:hypothetical protein